MRNLLILLLALSMGASAAVSPLPIPDATVNGITVGGGYLESYSHQVWRTSANTVYIVAIDDNPCQTGGQGVIRMWKGTGAQVTNILVPTGFSEMDSAHHPTAGSSGTCVYAAGYASTLGSPDSRMSRNGVIHVAYTQATSASAGTVYYNTYDTSTDLWGTRVQIAVDAYITPGADWPRVGRVALTLDANDIPHLVYIGSNSVKYTNRIGGSWSAVTTIYSSSYPNNNPSMVTAADGSLHLAWLDAAASTHGVIKWAKYVLGTGWGTVETVDNGNVLANGDDDQGPSVTVDSQGRPHVLYLYGTVNGSDNYVRLRYRAANGTWTDNTPSGAAGASNPNGTWFCHTPQNYMTATDDEFVFLAHDVNLSPGPYQYQVGGAGNNWSAVFQMDPRNTSNSPPGGIDGSAVTRYDPLRDTNPKIIDLLYYDEADGTGGYDHHSTIYYKAVEVDSSDIKANLWIDTDGGPCTRQATPAVYVDAAACSSFQAAQTAASAGDVIRIKNGTYGSQSISSGGKASAVNYYAETYQSVLVASLSISVDKIHVTGVIASGTGQSRGSLTITASTAWTDVVVDGFKGLYGMVSAPHVTVSNSEFGNTVTSICGSATLRGVEDAFRFWTGPYGDPSYDSLLNSTIHDWITDSAGNCSTYGSYDVHADCVQVYNAGSNITISGNTFYRCATNSIQSGGGSNQNNWIIDNNYFEPPLAGSNMITMGQVTSSCTGNKIRNNVFNSPGYSAAAAIVKNNSNDPSCNVDFSGNIFLGSTGPCAIGSGVGTLTGGYNVSGGGTCTSNNRTCTPTWLNGTPSSSNGYDIRLSPSDTCALNHGNASSYPATDMYGTSRPQGTAPDAGAYEYVSGAAPPALSITTSSLPGGTVGSAYSQNLAATGGTSPYTWALASGSLTACSLSLSSAGAITGTPSSAATCTFTARVTDSTSATATSGSLSIVVTGTAPTISTSTLPGGTVNVAYSQTLSVSGAPVPTCSLTAGALPGGLSLTGSDFCTISGTPTTAGTSGFTITAANGISPDAVRSLSIAISPPALTITTASLPGGSVSVAYSATLAATGGTPAYSWDISAGSLAACNLTLSAAGAITGTPTTATTCNATFRVTDSASVTATKALSVVISASVGMRLQGQFGGDWGLAALGGQTAAPLSYTSPNCTPPGASPWYYASGTASSGATWACGAYPTTTPPSLTAAGCPTSASSTDACTASFGTYMTDPDTGNRIMRITQSGSLSNTSGGVNWYPAASGWIKTWAADSSKFLVVGDNNRVWWVGFDPTTFKLTGRSGILPGSVLTSWNFSATDPDLVYTISGSNLISYKISTSTQTTIKNLSSIAGFVAGQGWHAVYLGADEACAYSHDTAQGSAQGTGKLVACYNLTSGVSHMIDTSLGTMDGVSMGINMTGQATMHSVVVGLDGRYVFVDTGFADLTSCDAGPPAPNGAQFVVNLSTGAAAQLSKGCSLTHIAEGHAGDTRQSAGTKFNSDVSYDSRGLSYRTFASIEADIMTSGAYSGAGSNSAVHLSWNNNANGLLSDAQKNQYPILVLGWNENSGGNHQCPGCGELYGYSAATTKGMAIMYRFGQTWTSTTSAYNAYDYLSAQISPNGKYALFASDWLGGLDNPGTTRRDFFVMELK